MIIVVDTNIVFRALLNTQSVIGDLLLNFGNAFDFRSSNFLRLFTDKGVVMKKAGEAINLSLICAEKICEIYGNKFLICGKINL